MSRIVLIAAVICCVPLATQIAGCAAVVGAGVVGAVMGRRNNWKKAYVRLQEGHDIDFAGGA